ncbi:MAG: hypothetical protein I3273_03260 [Candidatus Moeniiplasma glomeromycotorum]|nr:hypothetical protein [Candidatus Moeniiplasma glomeromycotorum]MCE8167720.1 hypothetical protein [Candidatus Moeniiplasma glomeromycotorum]MCE8169120.1 hypothetical protein [Candidatus Moeniiplasma glomeromycotorum]
MVNENKDSFLISLHKDLEQEIEQLKIEKEQEKESSKKEAVELVRRELVEIERKNAEKLKELENKLRKLYYWLFGIFFILLVIIIWEVYLFAKLIK